MSNKNLTEKAWNIEFKDVHRLWEGHWPPNRTTVYGWVSLRTGKWLTIHGVTGDITISLYFWIFRNIRWRLLSCLFQGHVSSWCERVHSDIYKVKHFVLIVWYCLKRELWMVSMLIPVTMVSFRFSGERNKKQLVFSYRIVTINTRTIVRHSN